MPTPSKAKNPVERLLARTGGGQALVQALVVFSGYLLLAIASYRFAYAPDLGFAGTWPPSGLALGVLVRQPRSRWPLLLVAIAAALVVALTARGVSPMFVIAWALADLCEPVVGALLIQRALPSAGLSLLRVREVYLFVVFGGIVGPLAGAVVASIGALLGGFAFVQPVWRFALMWWGSAALGAIVVGPLVLAALGWPGPGLPFRRVGEAMLLALAILALTAFGFLADDRTAQFTALGLAAYPLLAWAAIRFGPAGAAWGAAASSLIAIILTRRGAGPFADARLPAYLDVIVVQIFFALAMISALVLAAFAAERRRAFRAQQTLADAGEELAAIEPIEYRLPRVLDAAARCFGDFAALSRHGEATPALLAGRPGADISRVVLPSLELRTPAETWQICGPGPCWLLVPLQPGPRATTGLLTIRATRRRRYFDRAEIAVVEALAHRLALALERERLVTESERLYREAAEAVHQREQFISIASHELKTPLTPLTTRLEMIRRRLCAGQPVEIAAIEKAQASLGRLTWLVDDLLDVSRMQAGTLQLRRRPTSMAEVVQQVITSVRPGDVERIHFALPPADLLVDGDPHRLEQVAANLVDNALKYSPTDRSVRVLLQQVGGDVVLSVIDRGLGIPGEQLEHLFERFFRASNVSAARYGGLGLGLYIVHDIVERHGGRVWVESEVGVGSAFHVALPLLTIQPWRSGGAPPEPAGAAP